jgi:hypothetical protein
MSAGLLFSPLDPFFILMTFYSFTGKIKQKKKKAKKKLIRTGWGSVKRS